MATINGYYRFMYQRRNALREALLTFFYAFSSWPRLLLEVFLRRNMGERYFTLSGSIMLALILGLYPILKMTGLMFFARYSYYQQEPSITSFFGQYLSWYAFLAGFLIMALQRNQEIKQLPGIFELARFSLSSGIIHPRFRTLQLNGQPVDTRTIETLLEPGFCLGVGTVLWMAGQSVGLLIVLCSIVYSLSYLAAYERADHYIMDKMDELIANREMGRSFIDCVDAEETSGFRVLGRRPADPEARRELVDMFFEKQETAEAM
ncbi:hypothetical protein ACO2Q8_09225 [Larkinella sp. VNQ87]|uniref:hypothetical protein n=1 Tax=Larkinella sp. VNQ87 TaxID=3400921 RepID=UPI003C0C2FF4